MSFVSDHSGILYNELLKINGQDAKPWVKTRVQQLEDYWHLERYQRGAQVMLKAAGEFRLTGNFDALKVLADAVSSNKQVTYYATHCIIQIMCFTSFLGQRQESDHPDNYT